MEMEMDQIVTSSQHNVEIYNVKSIEMVILGDD